MKMVKFPCGSSEAKEPKTVNIFQGYFFMVNFCLGTGFLGVPFSFFYGGYIAAIPTLATAAFVTWLTSTWLLEVMARAQGLESYENPPSPETSSSSGDSSAESDTDGKKMFSASGTKAYDRHYPSATHPVFEITANRKFEPVELSEKFVGRWFKYIYLAVVTIYTFLSCWSYSTVAGSAWASNIPYNFATLTKCDDDAFHHQLLPHSGCLSAYYFSVFLFGVIVVFLSVLDLKEQVWVQMLLGSLRFLTVGAVVIYSIVKLSHGGDACADGAYGSGDGDIDDNSTWFYNTTAMNATRYISYRDIVVKFDLKGWVSAIPVFTYAYIIHTGISSLSHPVRQKKYLHWMLAAMSTTALVSYMSLGVVVPLWFKASVQETITLNWGGFTGPENSLPLRILSYYLILFPSLDVMSAFPLMVHCMVNNLYLIITGRDTSKESPWRYDWLFRFILRFVSAVLPLLAAMGIANLIYILKYAGLFGFAIAVFFPAVLQLTSIYSCNNTFNMSAHIAPNEKTPLIIQSEVPIEFSFKFRRMVQKVVCGLGLLEFRKENRESYVTHYSRGCLSHPLFVIVVIFIGFCLFVMACTSIAISPQKLTCDILGN